jgi:hypothetical protein
MLILVEIAQLFVSGKTDVSIPPSVVNDSSIKE